MVNLRQRNANGVQDVERGDGGISEKHHRDGLGGPKESRLPRGINKDGESNRRGINPWLFLKICFRSSCTISKYVNVLWPFVPAAIAIHFARGGELYRATFALNYIAMIPTANLIGFAGQELARKLPRVFGVILETFLGSIVEIILLMVLIVGDRDSRYIPVIKDAILGSILANLLLCLGTCFFVGGLREEVQNFDGAISEIGSGLLLTAGFGLAIPCAFFNALPALGGGSGLDSHGIATDPGYEQLILKISRATAVILLFAFLFYVWFQMRSHHGLYDAILSSDQEKDKDRHRDLAKDKLTMTECLIALVIALTLVSMHAVFLVQGIEPLVEHDHVSDMFVGLILVPLVEKLAEHLTAIDEAWDDQASLSQTPSPDGRMNFALAHVLGSTLQTALLNSSLVVIVGWGLGKNMDLNFSTFQVILLILAIIVVGNFIRDRESNYLEGALCILIYLIIAVAAYHFPNKESEAGSSEVSGAGGGEGGGEHVRRFLMGVS